MDEFRFKQIVPLIIASTVAAVFGLGVIFFVRAYSGYLLQTEALDVMQSRVRLVSAKKNELILKQKILDQTRQFISTAHSVGLSPARWTVYDVNLNEAVSFDQADQIISQCTSSQMAYFQPLSLQIKMIPKNMTSSHKDGSESLMTGDLTLSVQGKFVARKP